MKQFPLSLFKIFAFLFWFASVPAIGQVNIPFFDDFQEEGENGQLDTMAWKVRPNLIGQFGVVGLTSGSICSGGGQYRIRLGKTQDEATANTRNAIDLKLKLAGKKDVKLTFLVASNNDENSTQDGIYFSDGGTFVKVLQFYPEEWCGCSYPPINVDSLAHIHNLTLNDQFVIRFQQFDNADFTGCCPTTDQDGMYLDNVRVYSRGNTFASLPFSDDFEAGQLGPAWSQEWADSTAKTAPDPTRLTLIDNIAGVVPSTLFGSVFAAKLGNGCDGVYHANALDLHLNLQGQNNVKLTFDIYSNNEETHDLDALYFSNDGGLSFKKVFEFGAGSWCQSSVGRFPPIDVDFLCRKAQLSFTDKFVIRFQQYDDADFTGCCPTTDQDGFYFDNVKVFSSPVTYASVPFTDNFLTQNLGPQWKWSFADSTSGTSSQVTNIDNLVRLAPGGPTGSQFQIQMGKNCEGNGFSANALDLHLNLENSSAVSLSFKISNNNEEQHVQDSIYFSNDGGKNFRGVYSLNWSSIAISPSFTTLNIPISTLASSIGMALTDSFIVRIQQYDDADFTGCCPTTDEDGIYLDDFNVTGVVGVKEIESPSSIIYVPNPAQETITLQSERPIRHLTITDALGRLCLDKESPGTTIKVLHLSKGIYWLHIKTMDGIVRQKLVKD